MLWEGPFLIILLWVGGPFLTVKWVHLHCPKQVACLDVDGKDSDTVYPRNCPSCTTVILDALKTFNMTRDLSVINSLNCSCRQNHLTDMAIVDKRPLKKRIEAFLDLFNTELAVKIKILPQ